MKDGTVTEPGLMAWNEWQAWRSAEGRLPKGTRDSDVARKESKLWKAAMVKFHWEDWRHELEAVQARRRKEAREARTEVRNLFPSDGVSIVSSGSV